MRFLKNTVNDRIFPWTKVLAAKETMVECDKVGNIKLDHVPVEDGKILVALEEKAKECNDLRKQNAKQGEIIKKYESLHGKLKDQLPEKSVEKVIADAEAADDDEADESDASDEVGKSVYEGKMNKVLVTEIRKRQKNGRAIEMPEKINKDNLIEALEANDKLEG